VWTTPWFSAKLFPAVCRRGAVMQEFPPRYRIYLAGPDVFLPDSVALAGRLKAVCAANGAVGLYPMDNIAEPDAPRRMAHAIRVANEAMIAGCDAVVANMRPFRGPGMDGGTAYEIGYARALGKLVIGYTPDQRDYAERVGECMPLLRGTDGMLRDRDGQSVEEFGLVDNLMMADGAFVVVPTFEEAVALAVLGLRQADETGGGAWTGP